MNVPAVLTTTATITDCAHPAVYCLDAHTFSLHSRGNHRTGEMFASSKLVIFCLPVRP